MSLVCGMLPAMSSPDRHIRLDGFVLACLVLMPSVAHALPGPEVIVPVAAAVAQVLVVAAWIGGNLARRLRRSPWRWVVLLGLWIALWWFTDAVVAWLAVSFTGLVASRGSTPRALWAATLVGVVGVTVYFSEPASPPPLTALDPAAESLSPIHAGELEDFQNCRAPGGTHIRPADLGDGRIAALDVAAVLLVPSNVDIEAVRSAVGDRPRVSVTRFADAYPDPTRLLCYRPPFDGLFKSLVPSGAIAMKRVPGSPLDLTGAPWLRSVDLARLRSDRPSVQVVDAREIIGIPSSELDDVQGPVAIEGRDVRQIAAASRLLRERVEVVAMGVRGDPSNPPTAATRPVMWGVTATLWALLLGVAGRFGAVRAESAFARGAPGWVPGTVRAAADVGAVAGCVLVAFTLATYPVPLTSSVWVTPTMVGPGALVFGLMWLGLGTGVLLVRARHHRGGWRVGGVVCTTVLMFGSVSGLTDGSGPLPLHLAVVAIGLGGASALEWAGWRFARARSRGPDASWALLEWVDGLASAGNKASMLGRRRREGLPVPPGIVVWTDAAGQPSGSGVRVVRSLLGSGPLLVRSSSAAEDTAEATAAGRFETRVCSDISGLSEAVAAVAGSYPAEGRRPVLVMPLVECTLAGVARDPWMQTEAVGVEEAEGFDDVTSGRSARQRFFGRVSGAWLGPDATVAEHHALAAMFASLPRERPAYIEWLARDGHVWLVQDRPVPGTVRSTSEVAAMIGDEEPPGDGLWLIRAASEGLPPVASPAVAQLWADHWRSGDALGDAFDILGIPRFLAPERVVHSAWGGLWSEVARLDVLLRMVQLRVSLPASIPGSELSRVASQLACRAAGEPADLRQAVAFSVVLRLVYIYLPSEQGLGPPLAPTVSFSRALRDGEPMDPRWHHRAPWDLDPSCRRYGEETDSTWRPGASPPWDEVAVPEQLDQRWAAYLRDRLHDRLAWEMARLRVSDAHWRDQSPFAGSTPSSDRLTLRDAEAVGLDLAVSRTAGVGVWVSGTGPVSGLATRDPRQTGAGRILILDTPTAEAAAQFANFEAVVTARGGALSHAALVAREDGVPALFGVGTSALDGEGPIHLAVDGTVSWSE